EDRHEPVRIALAVAVALAREGMRSVVLRAAHDVVERVLRVDRQALVLKRGEPAIQGRDGRGNFGEPTRTVDEVGARESARVAFIGEIAERAVYPPDAAIVAVEED